MLYTYIIGMLYLINSHIGELQLYHNCTVKDITYKESEKRIGNQEEFIISNITSIKYHIKIPRERRATAQT